MVNLRVVMDADVVAMSLSITPALFSCRQGDRHIFFTDIPSPPTPPVLQKLLHWRLDQLK